MLDDAVGRAPGSYEEGHGNILLLSHSSPVDWLSVVGAIWLQEEEMTKTTAFASVIMDTLGSLPSPFGANTFEIEAQAPESRACKFGQLSPTN